MCRWDAEVRAQLNEVQSRLRAFSGGGREMGGWTVFDVLDLLLAPTFR